MIVVGGYYREVCVSPPKDEHFGSGGRAAIAIAMAGIEVDWHYYCPEDLQGAAGFGLGGDGVRHHQHSSADLIRFEYFHPLSAPIFSPAAPARQDAIRVEGDAILRFGLMEGDAVVNGAKVVFDPQSPNQPVSFRANGSKADRLAIVLNNKEVLALGESDEEAQAVRKVIEREKAEIVLVKGGAQGCRVYMDGVLKGSVPPYRTDRVYKIGSGDVFSAAFTYHWALEGLDPVEAADARLALRRPLLRSTLALRCPR
ncbi:carbohydrate kinase family protein [Parvularcula oceani]|uniref:carbohydrate kinase family protein n=1 Tax=Parvularcula oceani TaxID=1247963 RepID=UPI00068A0527|nr:carbohydrate kinase family protein [Parvularcula oceani]